MPWGMLREQPRKKMVYGVRAYAGSNNLSLGDSITFGNAPHRKILAICSPSNLHPLLHGCPWLCTYPLGHQMITLQQPKGSHRLLEATLKLQFFSQPVLARNKVSPHARGPRRARGGGWWLVVGSDSRLAVGNWRLLAVGGSWRRFVVGDWWLVAVGGWRLVATGGWRRLAAVGGWQLVADGGWWELAVGGCWSLGAVLKGGPEKKKFP